MPGLILIYWCHWYHFQSRMKPSLSLEYIDWIPEPILMKNVHLHKCCQSHWSFKGNSSLLATQLKAGGHPYPKGMQVFSVERVMGNKTKLGCVKLSGQSQKSKVVEVGENLWKSPTQPHAQSGCWGLWAVRFWLSPKMKTLQPLDPFGFRSVFDHVTLTRIFHIFGGIDLFLGSQKYSKLCRSPLLAALLFPVLYAREHSAWF